MEKKLVEIKRCPFCGNEGAAIYAPYDYNWWSVCCSKCTATVGHEATATEAISKWNERINP